MLFLHPLMWSCGFCPLLTLCIALSVGCCTKLALLWDISLNIVCSLMLLSMFSLALDFGGLTMVLLGMVLMGFILLEVCRSFGYADYTFSSDLASFWLLFLQISFLSFSLSPLLWGSQGCFMGCLTVRHRPVRFSSFLSLCSTAWMVWLTSTSLLILSPATSAQLLSPSREFFISVL